MISILLPTRKREVGLKAAVDSLVALARFPDDVEFVLRVDDDDPLDYGPYRAMRRCVVLSGPRWGYKGMHLYYDEVSRAASGEWLVIWNDDMVMRTDGWDEKLLHDRPDRLFVQFLKRDVLDGDTCDTAYPAYPKKLFDVMGRVSRNCHCDSWLDYVSEGAKIKVFRPDIVIHHDRPEDETARERVFDWEAFQGADMAHERADDVARIVAYLEAHPEARL